MIARHVTYISKLILHPSKVLEVQIKKENINPKAGQYIFISCPEISYLQYHPFTLTSAPEEDYVSVHMRIVGDWTSVRLSFPFLVLFPSFHVFRFSVNPPSFFSLLFFSSLRFFSCCISFYLPRSSRDANDRHSPKPWGQISTTMRKRARRAWRDRSIKSAIMSRSLP
jgi:hypothetical protein